MTPEIKHALEVIRDECRHCGCVFEADRDDYGLVGDAYRNQWAYMTCPTCGHKVYRLRDE